MSNEDMDPAAWLTIWDIDSFGADREVSLGNPGREELEREGKCRVEPLFTARQIVDRLDQRIDELEKEDEWYDMSEGEKKFRRLELERVRDELDLGGEIIGR